MMDSYVMFYRDQIIVWKNQSNHIFTGLSIWSRTIFCLH